MKNCFQLDSLGVTVRYNFERNFFFQGKMTNTFGMFLKYIQVKAFLTNLLPVCNCMYITADEAR